MEDLHVPTRAYAEYCSAIEQSTLNCEKVIKIGAKVVSHGRYIAFQMAEIAISRRVFGDILRLIATLRAPSKRTVKWKISA